MNKAPSVPASKEQIVDQKLRDILERVDDLENSYMARDMRTTFEKIGVPAFSLVPIMNNLVGLLTSYKQEKISLSQLEAGFNEVITNTPLSFSDEESVEVVAERMMKRDFPTVEKLLAIALENRAEIIFNQVKDDMATGGGKMLDFGAGDGQVTQKLREVGNDIEGFDVVLYEGLEPGLVHQFDGITVPREDHTYDTLLATNVFHHEFNNHICLEECWRLLKPGGKMVVIETIPVPGDSKESWDQTYFNDWFYNRPFHPNDNIPVPGTYKTHFGWADRFRSMGFEVVGQTYYGIDIDVIQDHHYKFVLQKPETASSKVKGVLKDA